MSNCGPNIPAVEHELFEQPPLKAMLGQVRFPPVLKVRDLTSLGNFQEAIREDWPEFAEEQQVTFMFGAAGAQQGESSRAFRFTTADKGWSVVLSPDAVTVEAAVAAAGYTSYDDFSKRFRQIWEAVLEHFRPAAVLRQGLRYVDHIEGDLGASEWEELINPELLGPLTSALGVGLVQTVSELQFRRPDGLLAFKHGIVPAGPEARKGYLLDFDYFSEEREDDVSLESIARRFDEYHKALYAFFRWCVTEQALEGFRRAG